MRTIFERIIEGELPSDKVFENARFLAIEDLHPQAPVHILILPKKHYAGLQSVPKGDLAMMGEVFSIAQILAEKFEIADHYRLVTNNGTRAGQSVFHLHFHLIGGRELGAMA